MDECGHSGSSSMINMQAELNHLRKENKRFIFSFRPGSQYCRNDFLKMLKIHNMLPSMNRKGNCREREACPWGRMRWLSVFPVALKTERVFFENYKTREEARGDIVDYIEMFYNRKQRHPYLGYLSLRDFEETWLLTETA